MNTYEKTGEGVAGYCYQESVKDSWPEKSAWRTTKGSLSNAKKDFYPNPPRRRREGLSRPPTIP